MERVEVWAGRGQAAVAQEKLHAPRWAPEYEQHEVEEHGENRITNIINILRRITWAVQLFPFFYDVLFVATYGAYSFAPEGVLDILDSLFYVSPIVIVAQVCYSYILHLCVWHRIACALPLIPQGALFIDSYVYQFSQSEIYITNIIILIFIIIYLIAVYKVFFTDGGRPIRRGNARNNPALLDKEDKAG